MDVIPSSNRFQLQTFFRILKDFEKMEPSTLVCVLYCYDRCRSIRRHRHCRCRQQ